MEYFTLLKYWRTSGATGGGGAAPLFATSKAAAAADYGFDGPYFDLELTLTDETSETTETECGSYAEDLSENESEKDGELRSPHTKFRVLSLKSNSSNRLLEESENQGRDRERGPLVSLFAIDKANHQGIELRHSMQNSDRHSSSDDRNLAKEVLQKYLNMLKPLYVGVEKMRFPAGQGKHLSKSRSTSAVSPPPGNRLDDSMLELQDGIEGAILHCKRSFNSDREGESANFLAP